MAFDISMIKATYERLPSRVEAARKYNTSRNENS